MTDEERIAKLEARIVELESVQGILVRALNALIREYSATQPALSQTQNHYGLSNAGELKSPRIVQYET